MLSILFVCMGNICRSPAAEGLFKHIAAQNEHGLSFHVESCGLGAWHVGQLADERMREAAMVRGVYLTSRAQQLKKEFYDSFDILLAADVEVLQDLRYNAFRPKHYDKIKLITAFSTLYPNEDVPDPYYRGPEAFDHVLDILEDSCTGLLSHLKEQGRNL